MPTPRHGIGAATVGEAIYIIGGATVQGFGVSNVNQAFSLKIFVTVTQTVNLYWNLISVPIVVRNVSKETLLPTSISQAYKYDPSIGYIAEDTLESGRGYWMKFDSGQSLTVSGIQSDLDTIDVHQGWNLMGTLSYPIATEDVTTHPPYIISSSFFGYRRTYFVADTLRPMKAYWVKVRGAGKLILSAKISLKN